MYNCSLVNVSSNINSEVCTAIERLAAIAALTIGGGAGSNINTYVTVTVVNTLFFEHLHIQLYTAAGIHTYIYTYIHTCT